MTIIKERLGKIKPRYLSDFEGVLRTYGQFGGGSEEEKFAKAKSFSNVYEMYIFAFFLGLRRNYKLKLQASDSTKGFWEIENWKPTEVVDMLYACAIAESNFDLVESELLDIEELRSEISDIQQTIESYANGGLFLIKKELEEDAELAADDLFFVKMLAQ